MLNMGGHLLLLSGGMDSALCLHRYGASLCVGFDYGQPHAIELEYAARNAAARGVPFERVSLPFMPRIDDVVFAGRNAVMLSVGAAIAQQRGLDGVMIGCNFTDATRFPDCRPEFLRAMSEALLKAYGVRVHRPLTTMTKTQIVVEARSAGIESWTCYAPKDGSACGECYACKGLQC